jgi:hypothetical protein
MRPRRRVGFILASRASRNGWRHCEVSVGALQAAQDRLGALASHVVSKVRRCVVAHRRIYLQPDGWGVEDAIAVALECLRQVGVDWSSHPTELETRSEYGRIW